ncbi:biotin/lipoyl-binding protein [Bartonella henselae]|uniref:biotin/lipoyl-binding protein n=1 Tax=Bartonella henselae TaxID=38323 RepID=UPI0003DF9DAF|nr:biotin/lipoyl-binding protein [Bartonella henselae]ETS08053.1 hypothetical protein Q653_01151 [Bartonella henselae JK 42]KEC55157.1 hypothetical protein O97_01584 [Bartonella henselae str. Zeus]KEC57578.1 hypothetical protein O95_01582 [Bartonella henselae JK 53]MDM9984036.1 biotin/lipoyl-binding protein [Bartonella henselae]MDM9985523.1 biotin/lipoyl-binding protein [Bartonella henselae]
MPFIANPSHGSYCFDFFIPLYCHWYLYQKNRDCCPGARSDYSHYLYPAGSSAKYRPRIEKILVEEQFVHQGDFLIQLDPRKALNERARVQADIVRQIFQAQITVAILVALSEQDPLIKIL